MLYRLANGIADLLHLSPQAHTTLQSCAVVSTCLTIIGYCVVWRSTDSSPVIITALEWSFATLMGSSAVFGATNLMHRVLQQREDHNGSH